jgi:hypothetical protein
MRANGRWGWSGSRCGCPETSLTASSGRQRLPSSVIWALPRQKPHSWTSRSLGVIPNRCTTNGRPACHFENWAMTVASGGHHRRSGRRLCENSGIRTATGAILASDWISARIGRKLGFGRVWGSKSRLEPRRTVDGSLCCWPNLPGDRRHQPLEPDQGDHALDVIGQHVQRHFGAHATQPSGQELAGPCPGLDCAERMLDR